MAFWNHNSSFGRRHFPTTEEEYLRHHFQNVRLGIPGGGIVVRNPGNEETVLLNFDPSRLALHRKMSFHQSLPGSIIDLQQQLQREEAALLELSLLRGEHKTTPLTRKKTSGGRGQNKKSSAAGNKDREKIWKY